MKLPGFGRASGEDDPQKATSSRQHHVAHAAGHRPGGMVDVATLDASPNAPKLDDAEAIDEEALLAEFEAEKPARKLSGIPSYVVQVGGVGLSLFSLYWVFNPMAKQFYLPAFLSLGLFLTFLTYRGWARSDRAKQTGRPDHPNVLDWLLALVSLVPAI